MTSTTYNFKKAWEPIPGTSQQLALDTRANHTLYCGTRGPGKTDTQLMRFRRRVGMGYGSFWKGIIFDRYYKNLEDIIAKGEKWFHSFDDGCKFKKSAGSLKWEWPTGEELLLRVAKNPSDYWNYHGHEYPFVGFNELTKYPTGELYDMMGSVNRSSFIPEKHPIWIDGSLWEKYGVQNMVESDHPNAKKIILPDIPLEFFSTTNPYGAGHTWVKRRFIDPAPYGQMTHKAFKVFDPRTQLQTEIKVSQVAIFGSWQENIYLDPIYIANLMSDTDESRRKAWLLGDWNIVAGGAISDLWERDVHITPRFEIPKDWYLDRTFDWGSSHPFSVGWWAEANGEYAIIHHNGKKFKFNPPKGTIVRFHEWYGTKEIGTNKGLKMSAKDIADEINRIEESLLLNGWIHTKPNPGPADNQIRDVRESDVDTIEAKMAARGVHWTKSDKSPGSRRNGLQVFRERLQASSEGEDPGIYFMNHCEAAITTLPVLPRDEKNMDDVDTDAEDHVYDEVRYKVLQAGAGKKVKNVNVKFPS